MCMVLRKLGREPGGGGKAFRGSVGVTEHVDMNMEVDNTGGGMVYMGKGRGAGREEAQPKLSMYEGAVRKLATM